MLSRKALFPTLLLALFVQLTPIAPVHGADTLVAFIPATLNTSLRYNVSQQRSVDTSTSPIRLWAFSETTPLWSLGGSLIVHGGLLDSANTNAITNMPSLRGATFGADQGLYVHSVYNTSADAYRTAKGMLVWKKENFLNGFSGKTIRFDHASELKVNFDIQGEAQAVKIHFAIKDGSTWYMSEASYVNQAEKEIEKTLSISNFSNNATTNKRWGTFNPSTSNFDVAALKPSTFSAKNFTNVQAIGLIYRTTGKATVIANIKIKSLTLTGVGEDLSSWQDSTNFTLNTSITGADVASQVTNFPVLIKLNNQNFSGWSQTQAGGADIRFTNRNGSNVLPYELVNWNATAKTAELWVLVDTIKGNNATQSIRMHWNPPTAVSSKSSSSAVFSTTNGFAGVWHLDIYANDTINDATTNRAFGINRGATDTTGAIGGAKQFNATQKDFISIANQAALSLSTNLTLSAWIASSTLTAPSQTVMSKPGAWALQRLNATDSAQAQFNHAGGIYTVQGLGSTDIVNNAFHYLTTTKSGTGARFFTNAILNQESTSATAPIVTNNRAITIGSDSSDVNRAWNGVIDEIRIESVARSADWIKLCYNNQKAGQSLVQSAQVTTTPPSFKKQPQPKSVLVGQSATFTIEVSGEPAPTVRWYRGNTALSDNSSISGSSSPSLTLSGVQLTDAGTYHCHAINVNSQKSSDTVALTVSCAPLNMSELRDTSVNEGSAVSFSVTVNATQPQLKWEIDSAATGSWRTISAATTGTLTITATKALNGARIRCTLSDICGSSESSNEARLTVRDVTAPTIASGFALTYGVSATSINISWPTPISPDRDLDSVWICLSDSVQPAFNRLKAIGIKAQSAMLNPDTLVGNLKPNTLYYIAFYLQDSSGNVGLGFGGSATTNALGQPNNPITLTATYIDSAHVGLSIQNFSAIPFWDYSNSNTPLPFLDSTYADTMGIWFSTTPFSNTRPDLLSPSLKRYSLVQLRSRGTTYLDTFTVSPLSGSDSFYYFAASLKWHHPDTLLPFDPAQSVRVRMANLSTPDNPCTISGSYHLVEDYDSATLHIDSLHNVDRTLVQWVHIRASFNADLSEPFVYNDTIPLASITTPALHKGITNSRFTGSLDTVFCEVSLISKSGISSSATTAFFSVGRNAPPNPVVLQAQNANANSVTLTWNELQTTGIQAMRIVYDTLAPIPTATQLTLTTLVGVEAVSAAAQQFVFDKLNEKTTYYFAAQIQIAGLWSHVTEQSRTQATTTEADTALRIPNSVHIDTVLFDTASFRFGTVWRYDTTMDSIQVGMTWGLDSATQATIVPIPAHWSTARKLTPDTTWLQANAHSFFFDTTYHFFIWVRKIGGRSIAPTDSSTFSITTPSFTRQPVVYFEPGVDTVSIDNGALKLYHTDQWEWGDVADTLYRFAPPPASRSGFVAMSQGYSFGRGDQTFPLWISFAYSSLPAAFTLSDLNIYRFGPDGLWRIATDSMRIDSANGRIELKSGILKDGFMVMIDTLAPTITSLADDSSIITAQSAIAVQFSVSDNIANPTVYFMHSRGGSAFNPSAVDTERINAPTAILNRTIPTTSISIDNGMRCYAVVNDGRNQKLLNLSRQVKRDKMATATIAQRWVPLHVTMEPNNNDPRVIMQQLLPENAAWSYDQHQFRLYRWVNHSSNTTSANKWLEYSSANQSLFRLTPGQVMWLKAREFAQPDFGPGLTLSLKDTVRIALPPSTQSAPSWSDIAVPFGFSMFIGDITASRRNGEIVEDLQFYHWVRDSSERFQAQPFYVPQLSSEFARIDATMRIGSLLEEAYTVYNPHSDTIWLNFPPQPTTLSTVPKRIASLSKRSSTHKQAEQWQLRVSGRTSENQAVGPLVIGFNPTQPSLGKAATTFFPQPPAFASCGMAIGLPDAPQRFAHAVAHQLDAQGGLCYELSFFNSSSEPSTVHWNIEGLKSLPGDMQVGLWDGASETITLVSQSTLLQQHLEPSGFKKQLLLVGSQSYFTSMRSKVSQYRFALLGLFPQPCRGPLTIRYTLPFHGVDNVRCSLFDARGRLVWQQSARAASLGMGEQRMQWNGNDRSGSRCASGMYLLKLSTHNAVGAESASLQQRVMLIQ